MTVFEQYEFMHICHISVGHEEGVSRLIMTVQCNESIQFVIMISQDPGGMGPEIIYQVRKFTIKNRRSVIIKNVKKAGCLAGKSAKNITGCRIFTIDNLYFRYF